MDIYILTLKTGKLLRSTVNKITKDKISENRPYLDIIEVEIVNCNIANNDYKQDSRVLHTLVPNTNKYQQISYFQDIYLEFSNIVKY